MKVAKFPSFSESKARGDPIAAQSQTVIRELRMSITLTAKLRELVDLNQADFSQMQQPMLQHPRATQDLRQRLDKHRGCLGDEFELESLASNPTL